MSRRIAQIALLVRDYDEAIRFFTQALGFTLLEDSPAGPGKRWVRVAPAGGAGGELLLARAATPEQERAIGNQSGGRVFLFLETDDFPRDYARMQSKGVRFTEEPRQEEYGSVVVFLDLYGNKWDLIGRMHRVMKMPVLFVGHGNPMNAIERNEFHRQLGGAGRAAAATGGDPLRLRALGNAERLRDGDGDAGDDPRLLRVPEGALRRALSGAGRPRARAPRRRRSSRRSACASIRAAASTTAPGACSSRCTRRRTCRSCSSASTRASPAATTTRSRASSRRCGTKACSSSAAATSSTTSASSTSATRRRSPGPNAATPRSAVTSTAGRHEALMDYPGSGADARLAVPTPEHYLPLLYAIALQQPGEAAEFFNDAVQGSISMTSVLIGASPGA